MTKATIHEASPRRYEGEICNPQLVRSACYEPPLYPIQRPVCSFRSDRRTLPATAHNASQAFPAHQPLDRASRYLKMLTFKLPPHLARSVGTRKFSCQTRRI